MFCLRNPSRLRAGVAGVVQISAGDHGGKTPRQGRGAELLALSANLDSNKTTCNVLQVGANQVGKVAMKGPNQGDLTIQN